MYRYYTTQKEYKSGWQTCTLYVEHIMITINDWSGYTIKRYRFDRLPGGTTEQFTTSTFGCHSKTNEARVNITIRLETA